MYPDAGFGFATFATLFLKNRNFWSALSVIEARSLCAEHLNVAIATRLSSRPMSMPENMICRNGIGSNFKPRQDNTF